MTEDGRQRAEDGRQKTEDRGQMTDDGSQSLLFCILLLYRVLKLQYRKVQFVGKGFEVENFDFNTSRSVLSNSIKY